MKQLISQPQHRPAVDPLHKAHVAGQGLDGVEVEGSQDVGGGELVTAHGHVVLLQALTALHKRRCQHRHYPGTPDTNVSLLHCGFKSTVYMYNILQTLAKMHVHCKKDYCLHKHINLFFH